RRPRAPPPPAGAVQGKIGAAVESPFARTATRRGYIMPDKPLYQPGETIWFRADLRQTTTLAAATNVGVTVQLVTPRGAIALQKRVMAQGGVAANDFEIPAEAEGGEFILR